MSASRDRTAKISGRVVVLLIVASVAVGVIFVWLAFQSLGSSSGTAQLTGSLFVSDAGQARGGFEYTASYNATLSASGGSGTLTLALNVGLGDVLTVHNFTVSNLKVTPGTVSMDLDGRHVEMIWTQNDTVWNGQFDNYYVSSWGPSAPPNEMRGSIDPSTFPGLLSSYYLELRLTGSVPDQSPSFAISPA